jgi:hypothetical protein
MDGRGSGDQGTSRQHGDTAFQQSASRFRASAAGTGAAEPFRQRCCAPSRICQPSHHGCRRDGCRGGTERCARPIYESPHGTIAQPERRGHLLVAVPLDRSAQERGALQLRQCHQAGEGLAHRDPALEV